MTIREHNRKKTPTIKIDKSLEKYRKQPIFQDKLDKANEVLGRVGLPKKKKHIK
jgi:hypothetical protein